jgi:hypothetical protein
MILARSGGSRTKLFDDSIDCSGPGPCPVTPPARWRTDGSTAGSSWSRRSISGKQGERTTGIEIIGHERRYGETEPSADIKSRFYGSGGDTLDYVYEIDRDTLTMWFGERGSPAYYEGTFSDEGDSITGGWVYPGGGGYSTTTTRQVPDRWLNVPKRP